MYLFTLKMSKSLLRDTTLPTLRFQVQHYSNSYRSADEIQQKLTVRREQQGQEISTKKTFTNTNEQAQAGTAPLIACHTNSKDSTLALSTTIHDSKTDSKTHDFMR